MKNVLIVLAVLCANFAFGQDYYLSSVVPYNKKMKDDIVIKNYSSFKISKVVVSAKGTEIGAVYNLLSYNDEKAYRSHCRLPQYIGSEFSFAIDCPDAKNAEANLSLSFSVGMHDLIVTITSDKDRNPWAYLSQQQPSQQQQPQPMNKKRKFWRTFGIVTGAALVTTTAVVGTVAASKSSGSGSSGSTLSESSSENPSGGNKSSKVSAGRCAACGGDGKCHNYDNIAKNKYSCNGSRKCNYCFGTGVVNDASNPHECGYCNGSGKCSLCNGTGKCMKCGGH